MKYTERKTRRRTVSEMGFVFFGEFTISVICVFVGYILITLAPSLYYWWGIAGFVLAGIAACVFVGNIILEISRARRKRARREQQRRQYIALLMQRRKPNEPKIYSSFPIYPLGSATKNTPTKQKQQPANKKPAGKSTGQQKRGNRK